MEPIAAYRGLALSPLLQELNLKGALMAAHQYLVARGEQGYLDEDGRPRTAEGRGWSCWDRPSLLKFNSGRTDHLRKIMSVQKLASCRVLRQRHKIRDCREEILPLKMGSICR